MSPDHLGEVRYLENGPETRLEGIHTGKSKNDTCSTFCLEIMATLHTRRTIPDIENGCRQLYFSIF